ncbi:hypothetical protein TRIP_D20002 [uncultured Paludibacter sp.]|nr:hypothetical protein TRIP_D20002 [uncultured Paludibacter sp.]
MATIKHFEDLEIWQKARELCRFVKILTEKDKFCRDFTLKDQILKETSEISEKIGKLIKYLKNSDYKGNKFKRNDNN